MEGRTSARTPWRIEDEGRQCTKCEVFKAWGDFHLDSTSKTGHQSKCKACTRIRQKEISSTEAGRAKQRQRTAAHRARKRGPDWQPRHVTRHAQLDCDGEAHLCTGCGERKGLGEFPRNPETPCGFDPRCSRCRHERRVERRETNYNNIREKENLNWALARFGITADEYLRLLEEQNGVCALCETAEQVYEGALQTAKRLSVDHDHNHCGKLKGCKACIRGLLCRNCNVALGMFESKAQTRLLFAEYLARRPMLNWVAPK